MKNRIQDLRNHLFATLEALRDDEKPMDLERARAIADVAQTIINTAKVEVDYAKVTGQAPASGFLPAPDAVEPARPRLVKQPSSESPF